MKLFTATIIAGLFATSTVALAHQPAQHRHQHPQRYHVSHFVKVLPNGVHRECRVEQHREPGRGVVRTQTCWRAHR